MKKAKRSITVTLIGAFLLGTITIGALGLLSAPSWAQFLGGLLISSHVLHLFFAK